MSTCWWHRKSPGITRRRVRVHSLGTMNVCKKHRSSNIIEIFLDHPAMYKKTKISYRMHQPINYINIFTFFAKHILNFYFLSLILLFFLSIQPACSSHVHLSVVDLNLKFFWRTTSLFLCKCARLRLRVIFYKFTSGHQPCLLKNTAEITSKCHTRLL